jgi:hypothetical protein
MIKLERSLSANFDAAGNITVRLEFDDDGIVRMFADTDKGSANCSWTIDIKKKSLEFTQDKVVGPQLTCIIACLGKEVGKTLLECLLDSINLRSSSNLLEGKSKRRIGGNGCLYCSLLRPFLTQPFWLRTPVCTENLNTGVVVMKSTQDGA